MAQRGPTGNDGTLRKKLEHCAAGLGDCRINTALCPGGKERMRRLMNIVEAGHLDLGVMVRYYYKLDDIVEAYDLFSHQRDGVLKVAISGCSEFGWLCPLWAISGLSPCWVVRPHQADTGSSSLRFTHFKGVVEMEN